MENKQELYFGDEVTIDFSDKPEYTQYGIGFNHLFPKDTRFFISDLREHEGFRGIIARRNGLDYPLMWLDEKRITKKNEK